MNIVFKLAQVTCDHDERGVWMVLKVEERSHVLWTQWEYADGTLHARVLRGRDLTGPHLSHAVQVVENEDQAFGFAETFSDDIPLADGGITLPLPGGPCRMTISHSWPDRS